MRIYFATSSVFEKAADYKKSIQDMVARYGWEAVFSARATDPSDALAAALAECEFAFFDLTGFDPDVMFALGVASQNDDVVALTLFDPTAHEAAVKGRTIGSSSGALISSARQFHGASDLQRKAHLYISEEVGPKALRDNALVVSVKQRIKSKGPIHMRQIAKDVGRSMTDVQPVVYELVRKGEVTKHSDKRWAQYS
jgi:hypothetical protein